MSGLILMMGFGVVLPAIGAVLITLVVATVAGMVAGTAILIAELFALIAATVAPVKGGRIVASLQRWARVV